MKNKGRREGGGLVFNRDGVSLHVCSRDVVTEEGRPKAKKTTGKSTPANEGPTSTPDEESNDLATPDNRDNPYNPTGEGRSQLESDGPTCQPLCKVEI